MWIKQCQWNVPLHSTDNALNLVSVFHDEPADAKLSSLYMHSALKEYGHGRDTSHLIYRPDRLSDLMNCTQKRLWRFVNLVYIGNVKILGIPGFPHSRLRIRSELGLGH